MSLSWILTVCVVIGASFSVFALIMGFRHLRSVKRNRHLLDSDAMENSIDVSIYAYEPDINGLDDIKAKYIGLYRETGVITGIEDESPVYQDSLLHTKDTDRELHLLVRSAVEVKRITDKTVIYFFKGMRPLNIKSDNIRVIYNNITNRLNDNKPVVLSMTRSAAGDE